MKLFDKRPLALILCITVGGFVFFTFCGEIIRLILLVFAALLGFLSLIFLRRRSTRLISAICSSALLISMLFSELYFKSFDISDDFSGEVEIEAVVYDLEYTDYSATLLMETRKIDGKALKRNLVGYVNKNETLSIDIGSVVVFNATLSAFSDEVRDYYYSRAVSASAGEIEALTVISQNEAPIRSHLSDFRKMLVRRAIMLSDREAGALTAALLIGERTFLGGNVTLDFKVVGLSHLLALSGMHLTILAAGITFLLSALGVNKKWRSLIIILITLFYMALTGFSATIMRAGIMLIISSLLFLLSSTHDALSSLVVSIALIVFFAPYAIYDLSLWLSAFATLGIIAFSELHLFKNHKKTLLVKFFEFVLKSFLASIFAICATLPFTSINFGTVSALGPIATLLLSLPAEIIMYIGTFMLFFGDIIPLGFILSPIANAVLDLVHLMSQIPGILSSTRFLPVSIIIALFSLLFFLFLVLNIKRKRIFASILAVFGVTVLLTSQVMTLAAKANDEIVYLSADSADAFIIKSDSETCLVDSSNQTRSTSYLWLDELSERGIIRLDKYYVTHYSRKIESFAEAVLSRIQTGEICLPAPQNDSEANILTNINALAKKYKVKVTLIEIGDELNVGRFILKQFHSTPHGEGTASVGLTIEANGRKHLYVSSGMYDGKTKSVTLEQMQTSYTVIFGCHGRKYSEEIVFDKQFSKLWTIILGSNNLTISDSTREYYELCGGEIYISPTAIDVLR